MTQQEWYRIFLDKLSGLHSTHAASNITNMVFESIVKLRRADIIKNPHHTLEHQAEQQLQQVLDELLQHKPIQYIIGETWFYHLPFKVNEHVLIPRPETEELVAEIQHQITPKTKKIIDIGTGSGCIAISLKKNNPDIDLDAVDVNESALEIAKQNAAFHATHICFHQLNFLDPQTWEGLGKYDVVVSNPPYIPAAEETTMDKNVTDYEPGQALFVPDDEPLIFYKAIAAFCENHLQENGKVFLETHVNFAGAVHNIFSALDYEVITKQDLFARDRFVMATRCH